MRARKARRAAPRLVDPLAQRLVRVACQRRLTLETHPQVNRGGNAAEQRGAAAATRRGRGNVGRLLLVDSTFRRQTAVPARLSEAVPTMPTCSISTRIWLPCTIALPEFARCTHDLLGSINTHK